MATAKEKREYIVSFGQSFARGKQNYIKETTENAGESLVNFLKYGKSGWYSDKPWCAAFISALAGYVDKELPGIPFSSYNSMGSSCAGAGVYGGNNVKNAKPGLVIRWKNSGSDTGHVGLVIAVSDTGITTVEGNTGSDKSGGQEREGVETKIKVYTWAKAERPASKRYFNGYVKIWNENDSSLGFPLANVANFTDSVVVENGTGGTGESGSNGVNSTTTATVQKDLSALFIDFSDLGVDLNSKPDTAKKPEKEIKKSGTASVGDVGTKTIINANLDYKENPNTQK